MGFRVQCPQDTLKRTLNPSTNFWYQISCTPPSLRPLMLALKPTRQLQLLLDPSAMPCPVRYDPLLLSP